MAEAEGVNDQQVVGKTEAEAVGDQQMAEEADAGDVRDQSVVEEADAEDVRDRPMVEAAEAEDVSDQQAVGETAASEVHPEASGLERGIDVSNWQGKIDWCRVAKAGIKHVCMKMTEGGTYVDPRFVENWCGAKDSGIRVNCYHYFRALSSTPQNQMDNIKKNIKTVNFDPTENVLVVDVEAVGNEKATPEQMADNLNALLTLIKNDPNLSRSPTMIYTSYGYWNSKVMWNKYNFAVYPLWVAHWGVQAPVLPEPWKSAGMTWRWWQYSSKGQVDGIAGDVDLDWVRV